MTDESTSQAACHVCGYGQTIAVPGSQPMAGVFYGHTARIVCLKCGTMLERVQAQAQPPCTLLDDLRQLADALGEALAAMEHGEPSPGNGRFDPECWAATMRKAEAALLAASHAGVVPTRED